MIKKSLVLIIAISFLLPFAFADSSLQIQKTDLGSVVISEIGNPAIFNFSIINPVNQNQQAEIYSFTGLTFSPVGFFDLQPGVNNLTVKVYLSPQILQQPGLYNLEYEIKGSTSGITKDTFQLRVVNLKDTIDMQASDINVGDSSVNIRISNTQNTNLENVALHFSSSFFDENKTFSLAPYQSTNLTLDINQNQLSGLSAGNYNFSAGIELQNAKAQASGTLNYLPKENSELTKTGQGIIVRSVNYTRTNTGNVPINAEIDISKDILSRLFTSNSANPNETSRNALFATYSWQKTLQPGESFSVVSTTNYTLPFILVLLIVIVALAVKIYTRTNLVIDKRVSYVKTKGGEFALKVTLHVKSKKYIENVQIIDRLPAVAQLYEKFGIMPDKIDPATKRLFWNLDRLNAGEERIYSYIIFSKVRVVGRFELPAATAVYLREGKTENVLSNRAFFVSETARSY